MNAPAALTEAVALKSANSRAPAPKVPVRISAQTLPKMVNGSVPVATPFCLIFNKAVWMTAVSGSRIVLKDKMLRYCLSATSSPRRKVVAVLSIVPPVPLVSVDSKIQPSSTGMDLSVRVKTVSVGVGAMVGVDVFVAVGVNVRVGEAPTVCVGVRVKVSVDVNVAVAVPVAVTVFVGVAVEVAVTVKVAVGSSVSVAVRVGVAVAVDVAVVVDVDVPVLVMVAVDVAVTVGVAVATGALMIAPGEPISLLLLTATNAPLVPTTLSSEMVVLFSPAALSKVAKDGPAGDAPKVTLAW